MFDLIVALLRCQSQFIKYHHLTSAHYQVISSYLTDPYEMKFYFIFVDLVLFRWNTEWLRFDCFNFTRAKPFKILHKTNVSFKNLLTFTLYDWDLSLTWRICALIPLLFCGRKKWFNRNNSAVYFDGKCKTWLAFPTSWFIESGSD